MIRRNEETPVTPTAAPTMMVGQPFFMFNARQVSRNQENRTSAKERRNSVTEETKKH